MGASIHLLSSSPPTQVLRTFLQLRLQDVEDPVAAAGAAPRHKRRTKEERKREAKQKLSRKQKKVRTLLNCVATLLCLLLLQRLQEEAKLDRDLMEASAEESREKRVKMVSGSSAGAKLRSVCLWACLSVCLSVRPSVCLSVRPSVCLSLSVSVHAQQTEVLKVVFLTYFRILKHSRHPPLLGPVLEGLAK